MKLTTQLFKITPETPAKLAKHFDTTNNIVKSITLEQAPEHENITNVSLIVNDNLPADKIFLLGNIMGLFKEN